ncbi:MAG: heme lyase CcmF/NrfE family subunit [Chloroflexi bacterium]|nr:heme lyase CcmF/NrfE family subunit [Chloroflexota bacterium]
MATIGYAALFLTFLVSIYATVALLLGGRARAPELVRSGENGLWVVAGLSTVASVALFALLAGHDFSVRYVYEHTATHQPLVYNLSAFWAGQEGSLLLWLWLLGLLAVALLVNKPLRGQPFRAGTLGILAASEALFALVIVATSNPFAAMGGVPNEGVGLNPLLQNIGMVLHPPVVFVGYAGFTVPFALALAALASGGFDRRWARLVRPWLLFSWLALGLGIVIGAWWAYVELGWGGYWGWDPVENSSLIPWLIATAALHTTVMQERRGSFRIWNAALITLTFILCLFASFVTRSGVIESVHAYGQSAVGWYFSVFIVVGLALAVGFTVRRRQQLADDEAFSSLAARESAFLLAALLFAGGSVIVFLGTILPTVAELVRGQQIAVGPSFYNRAFGPVALLLLLTLGLCPALLWGRTPNQQLLARLWPAAAGGAVALGSALALGAREVVALVGFAAAGLALGSVAAESIRTLRSRLRTPGMGWWAALAMDRRRHAAHLVHLSMVVIAAGLVGSSLYQAEYTLALQPGETVDVAGYSLRYLEPLTDMDQVRQRAAAVLELSAGNRSLGTLTPERNFHWSVRQTVSEVAVRSTAKEDFYVILAGLQDDGLATLQIEVTPLVSWLWAGGGLLLLGGLAGLWPARKEA